MTDRSRVVWDPIQYARYADHRRRPLDDLMARVDAATGDSAAPRRVVDLGCGAGGFTRGLADRWPTAVVTGVDSSPEMVAQATALAIEGRLDFVEADLRDWRPEGPVDLLVSNATLQWVPGHEELLGDLVGWLAPDGVLAIQVPGNFGEPSHTLLAELRDDPRWRGELSAVSATAPSSLEPGHYLDRLSRLGCVVDAWETTYLHVLAGEDPVLEWMKGTGLRPVLGALQGDARSRFLTAYAAALRDAYPRTSFGTVLPYRRVFAVARRVAKES